MIQKLFDKNTTTITHQQCAESYDEILKKREIIYFLIKEMSKQEPAETKELESCIPTLCESYVYLAKIEMLLTQLVIENEGKPSIKVPPADITTYLIYFSELKVIASELKYRFKLNLTSEYSVS